jgi:hypothetical protein
LPEPEFSGMGGGFKVAFKKRTVGEKGSETRVKTREKKLAIIKENPSVSMNELAQQTIDSILQKIVLFKCWS